MVTEWPEGELEIVGDRMVLFDVAPCGGSDTTTGQGLLGSGLQCQSFSESHPDSNYWVWRFIEYIINTLIIICSRDHCV